MLRSPRTLTCIRVRVRVRVRTASGYSFRLFCSPRTLTCIRVRVTVRVRAGVIVSVYFVVSILLLGLLRATTVGTVRFIS